MSISKVFSTDTFCSACLELKVERSTHVIWRVLLPDPSPCKKVLLSSGLPPRKAQKACQMLMKRA